MSNRLYLAIKKLVEYGIKTGLTPERERIYTRNLLLELYGEDIFEDSDEIDLSDKISLEPLLNELLDEAVKRGIIEDSVTERDLFDTKLMNALMPRPANVEEEFFKRYELSPVNATNYFYNLSKDSNYIRTYRIEKDVKWSYESKYGKIDMTINLSKPEKTPEEIAKAAKEGFKSENVYPKCLLCKENEGFSGNLNKQARQTLRLIPLNLGGDKMYFQYSPYVYYNEHCIVFNDKHIPMVVNRKTFVRLLDFVKQFPHYVIGSNADLPIVGGSILSHDHYQGGNYTFPIANAEVLKEVTIKGYEDLKVSILNWPVSTIRIAGTNDKKMVDLANHIFETWKDYNDESVNIVSHTDGVRHNTFSPAARKRGDVFELDLLLRNNRTSEEHPSGIFHSRELYQNIKRENLGLIEVIGLAILPARMKSEMKLLADRLVSGEDYSKDDVLAKHKPWVEDFLPRHKDINKDNVEEILYEEMGHAFSCCLEDAGVFKMNKEGQEAFERFIDAL
ncbi:MAG: UDP-glucose--hexose-1-phosphate uridylyltransferase [Lachnospiraceae bacterium]|jgi:UDPglucose--hexose-1-phosphate uridylyltransferase|nr:UDP-glucose--hexose-1-phosphate uridylyltransferase [Lachnospiraceae bacterium]